MAIDELFYNRTIEETEKSLSTDIDKGLSSEKAEKRLKEYGENRLEEKSKISIWEIFFRQFKSIVMLLLLGAAIGSFFIGEIGEGIAILVLILITAILGLIMEYRAGKSIEALQQEVNQEAIVIRDGDTFSISRKKLVPGDIVVLEEGDKIPADGRLLEADELSVDESMLTGESEPIDKKIQVINSNKEIDMAERTNMGFMGSAVTQGSGKLIVTATGNKAEVGKISKMLKETEDEKTPLEKRLEQTGQYLIVLTLIITAIVAVVGYISGRPLEEMLKISIALAIAAVPEGLPAVATITLAIGMKRMVKKNALMRNLPAVETLGSATILCTDKTGTLTENEMTFQKMILDNREINITGTGYRPKGEFRENEEIIDPIQDEGISLMLKTGVLSSDAVINEKDNQEWEVVGDPTEGALIVGARKAGLEKEALEEKYERIDEMPFNSDRKYMAVLNKTPKDTRSIFLKGAPEVVIEMCDNIYKEGTTKSLKEHIKKALQEENEALARKSFRVLALAYKENINTDGILEEEVKEELVFLGFVGMMDPPREGVKESIEIADKAGIRTIMVTGDQKETAIGIANNIGIEVNQDIMQNKKSIGDLSIESLEGSLMHNSVYARVTPKDKLTIITALKNRNEIVAMTGDGVNDAPALKKADIGVSMGMRGTSVAKEASDMILLDDRFTTIVEAVKQGRVIFDNIQKFVHYLLSCNLSEILFILLSIIFRLPLPLVALQILWLNVVTGVFPALAMAWEIPEAGVMKKKPRNPKTPIITNRYKFLIGFQGLMIAIGSMVSYAFALNNGIEITAARTIGFMTLAMGHLLQVFNVRRKNGLGYDSTIFKNIYLIGAILLTLALQLIAIYLPIIQSILKTTALTGYTWLYIIIGALVPNMILQVIALIQKKRKK